MIDNNRTGLIFRNQTDNTMFTKNLVTDNWTVGVLFLDASGADVPVQSALNSTFNRNDITGNWYGEVVDRQAGGALPPPGTTNLKNFTGNWFGTTSPVVTTANSTEPGYAAQIPPWAGGTASAPGGQPDIAGPASANIDYSPYLFSSDLNGPCAAFLHPDQKKSDIRNAFQACCRRATSRPTRSSRTPSPIWTRASTQRTGSTARICSRRRARRSSRTRSTPSRR